MKSIKKLAIIFIRPLYRALLEGPIWWFLARVKSYFFAEIGGQLADIGDFLANTGVQLASIERQLDENSQAQQWAAIEERLRAAERNNAAQWDAIEQLLLALYRQSEAQKIELAVPSKPVHTLNTPKPDRAHAASNIR